MQGRDQGLENKLRWVIVLVFGTAPILIGLGIVEGEVGSVLFRVLAMLLGLCSSFIITISVLIPYAMPESRYFREGREAMYDRELDIAIENLTRAVNARQGFFKARVMLARCLVMKQQFEAGLAELDKVIAVNKRYAPAYAGRAQIRLTMGDFTGAMEDANEAIRLKPRLADAYTVRGFVYDHQGVYEKAIADAKKSLQLQAVNGAAAFVLGHANLQLGNDQEAADAFDMALAFEPSNANYYFSRGAALFVLGDDELALEDMNEAIARKPNHYKAYFERGRIHLDLKNYAQAIADFDRIIAAELEPFAAYANRGMAHYLLDDMDKAKADFEQALVTRESDSTRADLGFIYLLNGQYTEAIANFEKAKELTPDSEEAIVGLALAHYLQGEVDKAREEWAELVKEEGRFQEVEWMIEEYGQHPKMAALIRRFFEDGLKAQ